MTERERLYIRGQLALVQEQADMPVTELPKVWEALCNALAPCSALGEEWRKQQMAAIWDVRDALARLEEGDDA